jgi:hypothetical protein
MIDAPFPKIVRCGRHIASSRVRSGVKRGFTPRCSHRLLGKSEVSIAAMDSVVMIVMEVVISKIGWSSGAVCGRAHGCGSEQPRPGLGVVMAKQWSVRRQQDSHHRCRPLLLPQMLPRTGDQPDPVVETTSRAHHSF